jgi:glutamate/tyrosine decarboxylase-like PLP-dependent enzyme
MPEETPPFRSKTKQLGAWFLGPKAENAALEEEMVLHILRDYFHWRRNYYPADEIVITQHMRREASEFNDALFQQLSEMLARLKRHFPFYSPRYIAHMLSDQTIPSVLGYFAGMLYNPNNVTPEAAPVTVEWELEVARDILHMLGYTVPPAPDAHRGETRKEFGWAHITGGGTIANIEALWAARNIRYFPLAVKRAVEPAGLALAVKIPGQPPGEQRPLSELDERQCLSIKPNEAVFLLFRFVEAVKRHFKLNDPEAAARAWRMLRDTGLSLAHGGAHTVFAKHPPALFVSGTAHYSIAKAADVLGIGRDNVILVDVDRAFRLDVRDLEAKMREATRRGMFPLAAIAIAGTTEEGAVDPLHRVVEFRRHYERTEQASFWLHVDAAWAGYLRSLFVTALDNAHDAEATERERTRAVNEFTARTLEIRRRSYARKLDLQWGSREVTSAFLAFPRAESIVVDPHKMGYVPYPCGIVAFRNDRVRHFLTQEAPYITTASHGGGHTKLYESPRDVGPYILEGSKPGAAAAACWLSHRMIPPTVEGYGEIMRATVSAARELYEHLTHWEPSSRANLATPPYQFVSVAVPPPDTNIVCFVVQRKDSRSLAAMNALGEAIYKRLTIDAEMGARDYAYSQPFFLSRTRFHPPQYSAHAVAGLLERAAVDAGDYATQGIFVLRATVMSPYIVLAAETGHKQDLLDEFVVTLARIAEEELKAL